MHTVPISEFKAKCLSLLQELHDNNGTLIITKHGKPFVEVRTCGKDLDTTLEKFRGSLIYAGDLIRPIGESWEAEQ